MQVPTAVARQICWTFNKVQCVILCYDREHNLTHTTTYGMTAFDKENAAAVGEACTKAIGGDLSQRIGYEDFHRDYKPAIYREAIELLRGIHAAGALLPETFKRVEALLQMADATRANLPLAGETTWEN